MTVDYVIKFGGSAITYKDRFEQVNIEAINIAICHLRDIIIAQKKCIIVHGAGSFGHFQAKKYNISGGFNKETLMEQKIGFSQTRLSVTKLNQIFVEALVKAEIPAVSVSACGWWTTTKRSITSTTIQPIQDLVEAGFIPVMHGDAVLDSSLGCTILSGDGIIKFLVEKLRPKIVVFITDTNGIYDRPPNEDGAKLLRFLHVTKNGTISTSIETSQHAHDVTGGVKNRIDTAIHVVSKYNIPVYIVKIGSSSAHKILQEGKLDNEDTATTIKSIE